ncbi:MAG TPA: UbiA family prenyltransferase [Spirochaetia bacterium]|nr:UbiA family prenyltransferase [Spirochaetia bacterium]
MKLAHFFALSRTPHSLLDLSAPAFAALVWLNYFPAPKVVLLGLLTSFAAYMAVYAFNDIVDYSSDKRRLAVGCREYGAYLDAAMTRHPVAQGILSLRAALLWAAGWAIIAALGSYLLNPTCLFIFLGAFLLEAAYCRLADVSPLRTLVAGVVKSAGPMAAVLAVDPSPAALRYAALFTWLFLWEIGGQNIPADWADVDEDRRLGGKTLPVRLQAGTASRLVLVSLSGAVAVSFLLARTITTTGSLLYLAAAAVSGLLLLIIPALRLFFGNMRGSALALFNRASYYPISLLAVMALRAAIRF